MKYLLDTNILIFWLKGRYGIAEKISKIDPTNCFISEVSVAELWFGVACSEPHLLEEKRRRLTSFLNHLQVIPFSSAIELYAQEKARLRSIGEIIPDFDLLIGATALKEGLILVSNNTKHLSKIKDIVLEDWIIR